MIRIAIVHFRLDAYQHIVVLRLKERRFLERLLAISIDVNQVLVILLAIERAEEAPRILQLAMRRNVDEQTRKDVLEFLPEVLVEPRVQEWIVNHRRHGEQMRCEEEEVVILILVEIETKVVEDVDNVQGQPAHPKDGHHQHQHLIGRCFLAEHLFASVFLLRILAL